MKPLVSHVEELRRRLLFIIYALFIGTIFGVLLSPLIIKSIIVDLSLQNMLVSLSPTEVVYVQIKVGFLFAAVLAFPIIFYHIIAFLKPGITAREKSMLVYFLPSAIGLFVIGVYFGYRLFIRIVLYFLGNLSKMILVYNLWSLDNFITFLVVTCIGIGLVFELPLVILILKLLKIVNRGFLESKRAHVYVLIFILAAVITPPDVITQILIGIPLIALYEISIFLLRFV